MGTGVRENSRGVAAQVKLTDVEYEVLLIVSEGKSMIPIGRAQAPVESLVSKGFLQRLDASNNIITAAGREALRAYEYTLGATLQNTAAAIASARGEARECVRKAIQYLLFAAKESSRVTGDPPLVCLRQWSEVALKQAIAELSNDR